MQKSRLVHTTLHRLKAQSRFTFDLPPRLTLLGLLLLRNSTCLFKLRIAPQHWIVIILYCSMDRHSTRCRPEAYRGLHYEKFEGRCLGVFTRFASWTIFPLSLRVCPLSPWQPPLEPSQGNKGLVDPGCDDSRNKLKLKDVNLFFTHTYS